MKKAEKAKVASSLVQKDAPAINSTAKASAIAADPAAQKALEKAK